MKKLKQIFYFFTAPSSKKIKGNNNRINIVDSLMRNNLFQIKGNNNSVVSSGSYFYNANIIITGNNNHVIIGNKSTLYGCELWLEGDDNEIIIGEHVTIEKHTHLSAIEGTKITLGDDCMLSSEIHLRTGDSHSIINEKGERINNSESVSIGNHVWIGHRVSINKGVEILDNSIIGAGSNVFSKFDKTNVIIVGSPAKILKENINWLRERI